MQESFAKQMTVSKRVCELLSYFKERVKQSVCELLSLFRESGKQLVCKLLSIVI